MAAPERIPPPPPGFYPDTPFEIYRRWDAYNWHSLTNVKRTLEYFKAHWDRGPDEDEETKAKFMGRLFHGWLLEPEAAAKRYVLHPSTYPSLEKGPELIRRKGNRPDPHKDGRHFTISVGNKNTAKRQEWNIELVPDAERPDHWMVEGELPPGMVKVCEKEWQSQANFCRSWMGQAKECGQEVVGAGDLATAKAMAARLLAIPCVQALLDGALREVSIVWKDPQTGLTCKARLDAIAEKDSRYKVVDAKKTAKPADFDSFGWEVYRHTYSPQMAMYVEGLGHALLAAGLAGDVEMAVFLVVEEEYPYTPAIYAIGCHELLKSGLWYTSGAQVWHGYLQQVGHAIENDWWPGHNNEAPGSFPDIEELPVPVPLQARLQSGNWSIGG